MYKILAQKIKHACIVLVFAVKDWRLHNCANVPSKGPFRVVGRRYEKKCTTANFEGFFCIYQKKVLPLQAVLRANANKR
jgi:hypothetical protein